MDYRAGKPVNLCVTRIPARPKPLSPQEVRRIRRSLKASQALFATYLNVSANAVRSWEQGTRRFTLSRTKGPVSPHSSSSPSPRTTPSPPRPLRLDRQVQTLFGSEWLTTLERRS